MIKKESFEDKKALGDYAEKLVTDYLISKQYVTYGTLTEGSHPFDNLFAKKKEGIWRIFFTDTKAKPKMLIYNATGIDLADYEHYIDIQERYGMRCFIYFVDYKLKKCYGNYLNKLIIRHTDGEFSYPRFGIKDNRGEDLVIFHMNNMRDIFDINENQCHMLEQLSGPEYKPPQRLTEDILKTVAKEHPVKKKRETKTK